MAVRRRRVLKRRTERRVIKAILIAMFGMVVLVAAGYGAFRAFGKWRERRFDHLAQSYLKSGDLKMATLTARSILEMNSTSPNAWRILAEVIERNGDKNAINCRVQVVNLAPDSLPDRIALAQTALRFNDVYLAERTLADSPGNKDQSAQYQAAAGQLAVAKNDFGTAAARFSRATQLDPANKSYAMNLAMVRLQTGSRSEHDEAARILTGLLDDAALRVTAARALRDDALRRHDAASAVAVSDRLRVFPEASFHDRINHLQLLRALNRDEFAMQLDAMQNEAAADAGKVTELLSWMAMDHLTLLAISWARALPPEITTQRGARVAVAECYIAARDWDGLEKWCGGDWRELEFLRFAFLARARREHGEESAAAEMWNKAVQLAQTDGDKLLTLEQGAAKWGWIREGEELLWRLGSDPQKQTLALSSLYDFYAQQGATKDLYRVVARFCEARPQDDKAQNNLAQLSLLLNVNDRQAHERAEHVFRKHPNDPVFVSTYAFSLYRRGRNLDAVRAMQQLPPASLDDPNIAGYYGLFLAAAGETKTAGAYIDKGLQGKLLPEEKALLESAREKVTSAQR